MDRVSQRVWSEVISRPPLIQLWYKRNKCRRRCGCCWKIWSNRYNWEERWNAKWFDGLVLRYAAGHSSELTDEQKSELLENFGRTTTRRQSRPNVWSSLTSVSTIVRIKSGGFLKSLGMHFGKFYPRDYRGSADAKTGLKKSRPWMSKHTVLAFLGECCYRQTPISSNVVTHCWWKAQQRSRPIPLPFLPSMALPLSRSKNIPRGRYPGGAESINKQVQGSGSSLCLITLTTISPPKSGSTPPSTTSNSSILYRTPQISIQLNRSSV